MHFGLLNLNTMATFFSLAIQLVSLYLFTRVGWHFLRSVFRKDTLAALPVPSGGSFLFGKAYYDLLLSRLILVYA